MEFKAVGLGFGNWDGEKSNIIMGMGKMSYRVYRSFETLVKSLNAQKYNKIVLKKTLKCLQINRCQTKLVKT